MTATSTPERLLPPSAIPDEALPSLEDRERPCEVLTHPDDGFTLCGKPAMWALSVRCDEPRHGRTDRMLTCDECRGIALACGGCQQRGVFSLLRIFHEEPLRSPP